MNGMVAFLTTWIFSFLGYLALAAGSGPVLGLWAWAEIGLGVVVATAVAALAARWFGAQVPAKALSPVRWAKVVAYACGKFFVELTKANFDVAWRVITGRIRPGIVKVRTPFGPGAGIVMLANSITLTPGTLTVEEDAENHVLYVHMINVPEGMETRDEVPVRELFGLDCPKSVEGIVK